MATVPANKKMGDFEEKEGNKYAGIRLLLPVVIWFDYRKLLSRRAFFRLWAFATGPLKDARAPLRTRARVVFPLRRQLLPGAIRSLDIPEKP